MDLFIFIYIYDKEFLMGSFVSVQTYDAKKTPVLTNVFQCQFFRSCECVVQWQTKSHMEKRSKLYWNNGDEKLDQYSGRCDLY